MTSTPLPRASSHQPNMGNVLADLRRASSSMFSSPGTKKSSPANYGDGPPRVQHRHPDDESSPGASDNRSDVDAPSLKPTQHGMQRMKLATSSPQSHTMNMHSINEGFNNLAKKTDERVQKAQTMEVGIFSKGEAEKLVAEDAVAADDATRNSLPDTRLVDEAAAVEECAKVDMNQIQPPMIADSDHATLLDISANTASHHGHQAVEEAEMRQQCLGNEVGTSNSLLASGVFDSTDSETRAPDPVQTRREMMLARRERARSRQPRLSSSPVRTVSSSVTGAATTPVPPATSASEHVIPDRGAEVQRSNPSVQASTASLARERYARHKKMLQQRRV